MSGSKAAGAGQGYGQGYPAGLKGDVVRTRRHVMKHIMVLYEVKTLSVCRCGVYSGAESMRVWNFGGRHCDGHHCV